MRRTSRFRRSSIRVGRFVPSEAAPPARPTVFGSQSSSTRPGKEMKTKLPLRRVPGNASGRRLGGWSSLYECITDFKTFFSTWYTLADSYENAALAGRLRCAGCRLSEFFRRLENERGEKRF